MAKYEFTEKELLSAVAYGIGLMCGKHNLNISRKEIKNKSAGVVTFISDRRHYFSKKEKKNDKLSI